MSNYARFIYSDPSWLSSCVLMQSVDSGPATYQPPGQRAVAIDLKPWARGPWQVICNAPVPLDGGDITVGDAGTPAPIVAASGPRTDYPVTDFAQLWVRIGQELIVADYPTKGGVLQVEASNLSINLYDFGASVGAPPNRYTMQLAPGEVANRIPWVLTQRCPTLDNGAVALATLPKRAHAVTVNVNNSGGSVVALLALDWYDGTGTLIYSVSYSSTDSRVEPDLSVPYPVPRGAQQLTITNFGAEECTPVIVWQLTL